MRLRPHFKGAVVRSVEAVEYNAEASGFGKIEKTDGQRPACRASSSTITIKTSWW